MNEKKPRRVLFITVTEETHGAVKRWAWEERLPMNTLVTRILNDALAARLTAEAEEA